MADYKLVDIEQLEAGLTATADAIREKTGTTEEIPWDGETGMAANIEEVFDAGKKERLKEFWDDILHHGERTYYGSRVFGGSTFNPRNFYPTYDIHPEGNVDAMFYDWSVNHFPEEYYQGWSLKKRLEECGVKLDTSKMTSMTDMFAYSFVGEVPTIDATSALNSRSVFAYWYDRNTSIEKIITNENVKYTNWFEASNITNVTFEGVIGNDISFWRSYNMTKESMLSIFNALSDTATGLTLTLSLRAVNNAFETTEGAADGSTSEEWLALAATKSNWTISLV